MQWTYLSAEDFTKATGEFMAAWKNNNPWNGIVIAGKSWRWRPLGTKQDSRPQIFIDTPESAQ